MISSTPGKIIVAGEYVGIFGKEVVVTAVDKFTQTKCKRSDGQKWSLKTDIFPHETLEITQIELKKFWEMAVITYERYLKSGNIEEIAKFRHGNLTPLKLAVARAVYELNIFDGCFEVELHSTLPIGGGLGSSASMCASVIGGIVTSCNMAIDKERLNKLCFEVERVLNGKPSGADNSAVVYGGWIGFKRENEALMVTNLGDHSMSSGWYLVNGGKPKENSLELINKVIKLSKNKKQYFPNLLEREVGIISHVKEMIFQNRIKPNFLNELQIILEEMGVIGERGKKLVRTIWEAGGNAKVSGAGGVEEGVGSILVYMEDHERLEFIAKNLHFDYSEINLGVTGWQIKK